MRFFERSDRITFIDDEKSLEKQEKPRSSDRRQGNKGKINETKLPLIRSGEYQVYKKEEKLVDRV